MTGINRVLVTGLSAVTASGLTADDTWRSILAGHSGIAPITGADLTDWTHVLGGELKDFKPAQSLPDRKWLKMVSRQDVLGIHAAMQAIHHSELLHHREGLASVEEFNDDTAVFVGSPGNKYFQQYDFLPLIAKTDGNMSAFARQLFDEVHPMWLLRILPNNVLAYVGIACGFKGVNHNITNHAVGGMQAIIEAYHAIKHGQAKRAVVVAYDIGIEPQALFYYEKLGVLSPHDLKPFDAAHDGTILAEGAAALILESEASADARQAHCYAEIVGGQSCTENQGVFAIEAEGESLTALLQALLAKQGLVADDVGLVVAHGNGNQKSDISEAMAINATFAHKAVPVTAFKWSTGHSLCASGVVDAVLATYALQHNIIPGIANLDTLASACGRLDVAQQSRAWSSAARRALLINRGFASMNACLLLQGV